MATDPEPVPDPPEETLPTPVEAPASPPEPIDEARTYLEVRPTESRLESDRISQAMGILEGLLRAASETGARDYLWGESDKPVIEWLLVAEAGTDPTVRYLVGTDTPRLLGEIEDALRIGFPDTYEFGTVDWSPERLLVDLPSQVGLGASASECAVAAVEYGATVRRPLDWQTPLASFGSVTENGTESDYGPSAHLLSLATVVETMVNAESQICFQVLLQPSADWTAAADTYLDRLETGSISIIDRMWEALSPRDAETLREYQPPAADRTRITGIRSRDPRRPLVVNARAVVRSCSGSDRADVVASRLITALDQLSGPHHEVIGRLRTDATGSTHLAGFGTAVLEDLLTRRIHPPNYSRRGLWPPGRPRESRGIVVNPAELPGFCVIDGAGLTPAGKRALGARPSERTAITLPPPEQLARFAPPGQALGTPLTNDRRPYERPLYLPPADQDRHVIVVGPTGSGKSVLAETAMLTNVEATDGPDVLLDFKGGGTAREYLQAHYRRFGSLGTVMYFDCTRVLPALSVLDISGLLAAGVPREEARSRVAGHYAEMLAGLMGAERFGQAVESPKVIRNHLRALFDPVHGSDVVSHADLFEALLRTQRDHATPGVVDDRLAEYFASLLERDRDVFNRVMGGALNRVEVIATDGRLAPVFDYVPDEGDPHFDFADVIDEDVVVVFDFGGMEDSAKRALTLALLSNLWRALQARSHDPQTPLDPPLVNCYLEEAGAMADSAILDTLLSQGRSFGLSLFLGVQFLGQLDSPDPTTRTHEEALNETATIIAGQVAIRDELVDALATDAMPPAAVNQRLSRMPRGEWIIRPGTAFGAESVSPFLMRSLPAPPGHPASTEPLEGAALRAFETSFEAVRERTTTEHGIEQGETLPVEASDQDVANEDPPEPVEPALPVDHCYAHSKRLTWKVEYDAAANAVLCLACGNRYDANTHGLIRAIECHSSLEDVDRDDIPIGDLQLKLSPTERLESGLSDAQLRLLQAVYNAAQERFHPLEYDLRRDSMIRLQEYTGIEDDEVTALIEAGLLAKDTDHPYRLYSVTATGRKAIGESYREGLDYGHGEGDLEESTQHILGVILAELFLEHEYVEDSNSDVERVQRYHDIGGNQRLDVAGLDSNDVIVVAVEVERVNHDLRRAAPEDFDKMASCEPEEAIWITMSHSEAHEILAALREPLDGEPRTEKEYSRSTPVQQFVLDEPGLTQMHTLDQIRKLTDIE